MLLKLAPLLLAIGYGLLMLRFSVWQTKRMLDAQSKPLVDAEISALAKRLARALDLEAIKVYVFEMDAVNGLAAPDGPRRRRGGVEPTEARQGLREEQERDGHDQEIDHRHQVELRVDAATLPARPRIDHSHGDLLVAGARPSRSAPRAESGRTRREVPARAIFAWQRKATFLRQFGSPTRSPLPLAISPWPS